MPRLVFLLLCLLGASPAAASSWDQALDHAQQARARLGPETWSQIIAIDNAAPDEMYPARVAALVFEAGQRLWLYVPGVGTESLSRHAGQLARDRSNLTPLLTAARPGFHAHTVLTPADQPTGPRPPRFARLPQACFVDAVARWHDLARERPHATDGRLIALYPTGRGFGHTVLAYEYDGRTYVFDPDRPQRDLPHPPGRARDARSLALFILEQSPGARLARAQTLALSPAPGFPSSQLSLAALAPPPSATERAGLAAP